MSLKSCLEMFKKDETRIENRKGATEGKSFK